MNDQHDLATAYALDALDELDRARFERHLAECARCVAFVSALQETAADLAEGSSVIPPPDSRDRVLARAESSPQVYAGSASRGAPWKWVAAAAAALVIGMSGLWMGQAEQRLIDAIISDPGAVTVTAEATPEGENLFAGADVVVDPSSGRAVLSASGMQPLEEGRIYELWVVDSTGPRPAGLFRPDADGRAVVLLEGTVPPGTVVALTIEPAGGSDQPTGEILMLAEVRA